LGQLAIEDGNEEAAKEILGFVLQNTRFRTAYSGQFVFGYYEN
jgi:hypothetical protein